MSNSKSNEHDKQVSVSEEVLRYRALSREIGMRDQAQRRQDAFEEAYNEAFQKGYHEAFQKAYHEAKLKGHIEEAIETLQYMLLEYHSLESTPYLEKLRLQPLDRLREIRRLVYTQETSLVIQELESL